MKFSRINRFEFSIFAVLISVNLLFALLSEREYTALLNQMAFVITSGTLIWLLLRQMGSYLVHKADQMTPQKGALFITSIAILTGGTVGAGMVVVWQLIQGARGLPNLSLLVGNFLSFGFVTAVITSIFILGVFLRRWKTALLEEEKLKQALLKAEFDSLKNQVNPHFLFNSLNVLSALIPEDPGNAVNLVEKLSKVFRYNLQNSDRSTVELSTELKVIESYLFIHKMRFGENLLYTFDVPEPVPGRHIVPQGMLTLVENAIKHNECSQLHPLTISICAEGDYIRVTNTYQPRRLLSDESTGIGLTNLKSRYSMLTKTPVVVESGGGEFSVSIPLLSP